MAPTTFSQFSLFALEIRTMIWEICWQKPSRIVYLQNVPNHDDNSWKFASQRKPPFLHACRESAMFRGNYTKTFRTMNTPPTTWFDFELDILYLDCRLINDEFVRSYQLEDLLPQDVERVQNLAIYSIFADGLAAEAESILKVLNYFKNVKKLTWAVPYHNKDCAQLVFPNYSTALEEPEYQSYHSIPYHPVLHESVPGGSRDFETEECETSWIDKIGCVVAAMNNSGFTDPEWE